MEEIPRCFTYTSEQHLFQTSSKGAFKNPLEKLRLKKNFKPHLEDLYKKYVDDSPDRVKMMFLMSVLDYADCYGSETFEAVDCKVVVSPHHATMPGIFSVNGPKVGYILLHVPYYWGIPSSDGIPYGLADFFFSSA